VKSRIRNQPRVEGTLYIISTSGFVLIWTSFQAYAKYLPQEQTPKSRNWIIFQLGRDLWDGRRDFLASELKVGMSASGILHLAPSGCNIPWYQPRGIR